MKRSTNKKLGYGVGVFIGYLVLAFIVAVFLVLAYKLLEYLVSL